MTAAAAGQITAVEATVAMILVSIAAAAALMTAVAAWQITVLHYSTLHCPP
jgi:hypothetical protein